MKAVVYVLLAGGLLYASAYALGAMLLRAWSIRLVRPAERFIAFAAGSALLSTLIFLLTAAGLARKGVFLGLTVPLIACAAWRGLYRPQGDDPPRAALIWRAGFWVLFALFTFYYLGNALAPESSPDGVGYHAGLPARYLREHRFPHITTNMYANLTAGVEMLFEYAISIGRFSAASFTHYLFLVALTFGIAGYGREIGRPRAGLGAALLVYLSPVVARDGTVAYVDVAAAAVAFALFYILRGALDWRRAALAGLLAGFGFAVKYTLFTGVAYAGGVLLWQHRREWRAGLRRCAVAAAFAMAMIAPYLVKNAIFAANPFSPFLNRWFPNPYVTAYFEQGYTQSFRHMNGVSLAQIPWEVTVSGERLSGLIGPVFLLLPLAVFALRSSEGRRLLLAAAVFLVPYFGNIGTRFLIPMLPFAALALALVLDEIRFGLPLVVAAHAAFSWPPNITAYSSPYAWRIERPNWAAALRLIPEDEYLLTAREDHAIVRDMERLVPAEEAVFAPSLGNQTYHTRHVIGPFESALGNRMYDLLFRVTMPDLRTNLRYRYSFTPVAARRVRIVLNHADPAPLNIAEVRIWSGGKEVERSGNWRIRASHNPWDAPLAFDNSPLTVWNPAEATRPGMFVEIDFGAEKIIDGASVEIARNQTWASLRIDVESNGSWRALASEPQTEETPWTPLLRGAAAAELKANGIRWLVFRDGDLLADDLLLRSRQWGIRQVAEKGPYRLWHID